MWDSIGQITKVVACTSNPEREFIFAEGMPESLGIRDVDLGIVWWYTGKEILDSVKEIETESGFWLDTKTELAFWREALRVFRRSSYENPQRIKGNSKT